jgi:electron transfer flavoprotein alpha subunit
MILIVAELQNGKFKKQVFEAVTYASKVGQMVGEQVAALVLGRADNPATLAEYGASSIYTCTDRSLDQFDSMVYSAAITQMAERLEASLIILPHTNTGKSLLGRVTVKMNASSVSGVVSLPEVGDGFKVKKSVFSGKAIATYLMPGPIRVITLMGNSLAPEIDAKQPVIEEVIFNLPASSVQVLQVSKVEGIVPLPEAEKVVSAGRGLKGPENWTIIEELANELGATTACSRPVADVGWRPHHEHVGQTGIAIRPNLYIAIGISGAIQHLAGVNNSKTIVVINKDPEAPFFKAADYGIVGDLFDVVPKLTEAIRAFKNN